MGGNLIEDSGAVPTPTSPRKGYRKLATCLSGLVLLALLVVLGTWFWRSMAYVSTDDAQIQADVVTISSDTSGRIEVLTKEEGDSVFPGEVLARLDSREIRIQIRQAQADLDRARSRWLQARREVELHLARQKEEIVQAEAALRSYRHNVEDARAHAKIAKEDWQRAQELFRRELISKQKQAHAETEVQQTKARVAALEEKVKQGEAALKLVRIRGREVSIKKAALQARQAEVRSTEENLADLKHKLKLMSIRSPVRGTIAKRDCQQGEFVQPGQPIFMVVNTTQYWVEANVEETKIRFVKPGDRAIIRVDSYPGHDFSGRVLEVGEATVSTFSLFSPAKLTGVFIKSTQRLPVRITVENTDGKLKVGMLAVVWIEKDSK